MFLYKRHLLNQHQIGLWALYLDAIFDLPGVVSDDERRLHDSGKLDVAAALVLTLKLIQKSLIRRLWKTTNRQKYKKQALNSYRNMFSCLSVVCLIYTIMQNFWIRDIGKYLLK